MPKREDLVTITQVTDHDSGMYYIGEIDGLLQKNDLQEFLKRHGEKGKNELVQHLAFLQHQIISEWLELQTQDNQGCSSCCK